MVRRPASATAGAGNAHCPRSKRQHGRRGRQCGAGGCNRWRRRRSTGSEAHRRDPRARPGGRALSPLSQSPPSASSWPHSSKKPQCLAARRDRAPARWCIPMRSATSARGKNLRATPRLISRAPMRGHPSRAGRPCYSPGARDTSLAGEGEPSAKWLAASCTAHLRDSALGRKDPLCRWLRFLVPRMGWGGLDSASDLATI